MSDRNQRIFIFIGSVLVALLVILVVMLVTSEDSQPVVTEAAVTTVIESTTLESAATTEAPSTTELAPDTTAAPNTTEAVEEPPPPADPPPSEDDPPPSEPVEVFRGIADVSDPGLFGTGTVPLFAVSVAGDEFATSHPWSLMSSAEPSWQACAAQTTTGRNVANPVKLLILGISNGWYGCSRMEDDHLVRIHLIDVQPTNRRVIAEIVIWNVTP